MATIDISRSHSLDLKTAKERAAELADGLKEKLSLDWHWEGDDIRFKGNSGPAKGVTGKVTVGPAKVRAEIDLPFLLRALKGTVKSKVDEKLDRLVR